MFVKGFEPSTFPLGEGRSSKWATRTKRQRKDLNLHRSFLLHSPSKRVSYQLEYAAISAVDRIRTYIGLVNSQLPQPLGYTDI